MSQPLPRTLSKIFVYLATLPVQSMNFDNSWKEKSYQLKNNLIMVESEINVLLFMSNAMDVAQIWVHIGLLVSVWENLISRDFLIGVA